MKNERSNSRRSGAQGFTLIELMIVVAVIAILAAIAYPSYTRYVMRAKRADAKQALLQAAQWMERSYTANYSYPTTELPAELAKSPAQGTKIYTISRSEGDATSFTLSAVPVPEGAQAKDECGTLTIDHRGVKGAKAGTSAEILQTCWSN